MKLTPGAVTGPEDSYTDFGPDIDYERTLGKDVLSLRASYVRENAALVASAANGAASPGPHHLNASNANVAYHLGNPSSGTLGRFLTDGTNDPLCTRRPRFRAARMEEHAAKVSSKRVLLAVSKHRSCGAVHQLHAIQWRDHRL